MRVAVEGSFFGGYLWLSAARGDCTYLSLCFSRSQVQNYLAQKTPFGVCLNRHFAHGERPIFSPLKVNLLILASSRFDSRRLVNCLRSKN